VIYTDGACSGNGTANARGGWAAVVIAPGAETEPLVLSGGEKPATNQRMEIVAAIKGLEALARPSKVRLYSDSAYLVNCHKQKLAPQMAEQRLARLLKEACGQPRPLVHEAATARPARGCVRCKGGPRIVI